MKAFFGPPVSGPVPGGTQLSLYLVPVFEGRLVAFDVVANEARGRWLPWDVLDSFENPYEAASELADFWCGVSLTSLALSDVMSFTQPGGSWELAVVFRAELSAAPVGDSERAPFVYAAGQYDAIGNFDPVDLERWVTRAGDWLVPISGPHSAARPNRSDLLF
ncbi:MAG: hypothetical protein ABI939_00520 [Anaerolineaceae bacterium]